MSLFMDGLQPEPPPRGLARLRHLLGAPRRWWIDLQEANQLHDYEHEKITIKHHQLTRVVIIGEMGQQEFDVVDDSFDLEVTALGRTLIIHHHEDK